MKNILIFSDLHISNSSLSECKDILNEILSLAETHQIDTIIDLGDTFDSIKPSSSELDLFADFIKRANRSIIVIAAKSHESETSEHSILNHYGILNDNVWIVKEFSADNKLFCGHFSIKESSKNFDAKLSQKDLKYKWVFLGHIHSYQIIKPNICHIGSCRWVNFDETEDKVKKIAIITEYNTEKEAIQFINLKSPISMISLELGKNTQNSTAEGVSKANIVHQKQPTIKRGALEFHIDKFCKKLDNINSLTKIRIVFKDYSSWITFLPHYQRYKDKFVLFKDKKEFTIFLNNSEIKKETDNLTGMLKKWIKENKVPEKITEILLKEVE